MRAAGRTWQAIGADILQASSIPYTSGKGVSRATVVDVVLDHIRTYGDQLDFTEYNTWSYAKKVKVLRMEFRDRTYGW